MAGTHIGSLKAKLGLRGATKPGDMIARMNALNHPILPKFIKHKTTSMQCKNCGMNHKTESCAMQHKFDLSGLTSTIGNVVSRGEHAIGTGLRFAGNLGKAFIRNATGGDVRAILKNKKTRRGKH